MRGAPEFPVAFVRWRGTSPFFNPATPFAGWIDGFVDPRRRRVRTEPALLLCERRRLPDMMGMPAAISSWPDSPASRMLATAIDAFQQGQR